MGEKNSCKGQKKQRIDDLQITALKSFFTHVGVFPYLKKMSIWGQHGSIKLPWLQHHKWALVHVPDALLLIQFTAYGLEKQWRMVQVLGFLHPM